MLENECNEGETMVDDMEGYDETEEHLIQCEGDGDEEVHLSSNDGDSLLIELVQGYPYIYDNRRPEFKDVAIKEKAWAEISHTLAWTVPECQNRWLRLREKYARETRVLDQAMKNGQPVKRKSSFALFDKLKFLRQHVKRRRTYPKLPPPTTTILQSELTLPKSNNPNKLVRVQLPPLLSGSIHSQSSIPTLVPNNPQTVTISSKTVSQSTNQPAVVQIHQPALVQIIRPLKVATMDDDSLTLDPSRVTINSSAFLDSSDTDDKLFANGVPSNKNQNAETLFGQFITAELLKLPDPLRKQKKQKIMQILCE